MSPAPRRASPITSRSSRARSTRIYGLYNVCQLYSPSATLPQEPAVCCAASAAIISMRRSAASWKRKVIDPIGGVWTPFAFARVSSAAISTTTGKASIPPTTVWVSRSPTPRRRCSSTAPTTRFRGQATPGVGVEWRYPILARSRLGDIVVEPIAQVIARPNQTSIPSLVNMDAQSLVFDDSTLFEWSKFSGYDRFETGTRLNYGGQATLTFANGGFVNAHDRPVAPARRRERLFHRRRGQCRPRFRPRLAHLGHCRPLRLRALVRAQLRRQGPLRQRTNLRARRIDLFASINLDPL